MKIRLIILLIIAITISAPLSASAHEHQTFKIGDKIYSFVVGFLNEPAYIDDKSGLDLRIELLDSKDPKNTSRVVPVSGLEQTLQVEVSANNTRRTFPLEPTYNNPGSYHAIFFPSTFTTYSYRIFGKINNIDIDIPFTCAINQGNLDDDNLNSPESSNKINDNVERLSKAGSFGCPKDPRLDSFPKQIPIKNDIISDASNTKAFAITALAIGIVSLLATTRLRNDKKS